MKRSRFFLAAFLVVVIATCVFAAGPMFSVMGYSQSTDYTFTSDTAVTIQAAMEAGTPARTWLVRGRPPVAFTVQPETYGIRLMFEGTPSVDNTGIVILAGETGRWPVEGPTVRICNKVAGSNAKVHMIFEWDR